MTKILLPIPGIPVTGGQAPLPPTPGPGLRTEMGSVTDAVEGWRRQGAHWMCVTDADGHPSNPDLIHAAIASGRGSVRFLLNGGVVDQPTLNAALATGATRVVIDIAQADRDWAGTAFASHGQHVVAGLRANGNDLVAADGSRVGDLYDTILDLNVKHCPRYLVEDAGGAGHWFHRHEEQHVLAAVCETTKAPVIAFGGVSKLSDIHALAALVAQGLEGAVMTEPLNSGRFSFEEAVTAAEPRFDPYEWGPARP